MTKLYFKSGKGIQNPVDFNGNLIKKEDILTHCWWETDYVKFFNETNPKLSLEEIETIVNLPKYKVKTDKNGIYFGEGLTENFAGNRNYLHDFLFKFCKIVKI